MGDSVETEKKIAIATELNRLIKESARAISQLEAISGQSLIFMIFAQDDYLRGKQFVGDPTMNKMINAYAEHMANLGALFQTLQQATTIRNDDPATFRANLDQFIASRGENIEEIRKRFD